MPTHRYRVVDVFTRTPLEGNPLAVFTHAASIGESAMQRIAKELNLSETVFLLPSTRAGCASRARIFTPTQEMIFAGHPTLGASYVLMQEGIVPADTDRFVLDEAVGPVPIRVEPGSPPRIWLTTPPIEHGAVYDRDTCADALGLDSSDLLNIAPQLLSAGNPAVYIALKDKETVDRAWLDSSGLALLNPPGSQAVCVFVFTPTPEGAYSRMFAPGHGVAEDPATGSATGPLAAYMKMHKLVVGNSFVSEQGVKMGRRSLLYVEMGQGSAIDVGGYVTPLVEATMTL